MTGRWSGNSATNRKEELPADWGELRKAQLREDGYRCRWKMPSGDRCPNEATDVDHAGAKWDHGNLRSLCEAHHDKRTALQGAKEAAQLRAVPPRKPPSIHPSQGFRP